ncbi:hypothetical protein [Psychrobacillus sp. FSL K6-1464]|uniref:hypothetical protein n=1 Tax=Psychrobacillus sp. FSL K6-1464 TaxID=2921545 RepID=UPI0030F5F6F5
MPVNSIKYKEGTYSNELIIETKQFTMSIIMFCDIFNPSDNVAKGYSTYDMEKSFKYIQFEIRSGINVDLDTKFASWGKGSKGKPTSDPFKTGDLEVEMNFKPLDKFDPNKGLPLHLRT